MTSWPQNAYVGQKVVCVDVVPQRGCRDDLPLKLGEVYTIRWLGFYLGDRCLRLEECTRPDSLPEPDRPMLLRRFRPVQSTDTGMSILKELLINPHEVLEDA